MPQLQLKDRSREVYSAVHGTTQSMRADLSKPLAPLEIVSAEEAKIPRCQRPSVIAAARLAAQAKNKSGIELRIWRILVKQVNEPGSVSKEETIALELYKEWHAINRRKCAMAVKRLREQAEKKQASQAATKEGFKVPLRALKAGMEPNAKRAMAIAERMAKRAKLDALARAKRLKTGKGKSARAR